jgi:hypothetical protein
MERRKLNPYVLAAIAIVHVAVVALTWRDISARPVEQMRGNKRFWRVFSALNTGHAAAYWLIGRRRT